MPHQLCACVVVVCFVAALVQPSLTFRPSVIYMRESNNIVGQHSNNSLVDGVIAAIAGLNATQGAPGITKPWSNRAFALRKLRSKVRGKVGSFSAQHVAHEFPSEASPAHAEVGLAQLPKAIVGLLGPLSVASSLGSSIYRNTLCQKRHGERRVGCKLGCACQRYEQCFAKRSSEQPFEDSGVCEMSVVVIAVLTIAFEVCLLFITVAARLALQHRDFLRDAVAHRAVLKGKSSSHEATQWRASAFQQYGLAKLMPERTP